MSLFRRMLTGGRPSDPRIMTQMMDEREAEQRLFQSSVFPTNSTGDGTFSTLGLYGQMRDEQALRLIAVYACVRLLADSVASLPFSAYRMDGAGPSSTRVKLDPQPTLITSPGGPDEDDPTNFEFFFQIMSSLALNGNAYLVITRRDYRDNPLELYPVHPDDVTVSRSTSDGKADYRVGNELVPRYDMVHIKRFMLPGRLTGLSPIGLAAQGVGLGLAAERYGARYFNDSASPSSVLETDANLGPEASSNVMKNWMATHGGHRYPAILSGGLKYKPISINPNESQFLETRRFQRTDIAMLFGVPPHMISDTEKSTSYGTGIEQQGIGYVVYTMRPWVTCIEHAFNKITPRGTFSKFSVDGLLRGDVKSRWESYIAGRNAGALSVNDIRRYEDLPPVPGGDVYLQPMNYVPLGTSPSDYPTGGNNDDTPGGNAPSDGSPGTDPSNKNNGFSDHEVLKGKNGHFVYDLGSLTSP
jgi:HK97 family phage portal protein